MEVKNFERPLKKTAAKSLIYREERNRSIMKFIETGSRIQQEGYSKQDTTRRIQKAEYSKQNTASKQDTARENVGFTNLFYR